MSVMLRLRLPKRLHLTSYLRLILLWVIQYVLTVACAQTLPAQQLPTGGVVSSGQATISQSGNTLNINQTSQRAVVDWTSLPI